ncbi:MAG: leucyl aminopeptidase [Deltaproteobacteria bacterium]|nr:leucyl aminopeptidase [Deltaproteobacteria bacterium]
MKLLTSADAATELATDLLAVALGTDLSGLDALDARFDGHLRPLAEQRKFEGKAGQSLLLPTLGRLPASHLLLLGIGAGSAAEKADAAGLAGLEARKLRAATLVLDLGPEAPFAQALERLAVGNYAWEAYRPEDQRTPALEQLTLVGADGTDLSAALARAEGQRAARDWVNLPAADLYPETLASSAVETFAGVEGVTVEVWDLDRCRAEDCVGILAVGAGSARPGRMIRVSYRPATPKAHVALVGKGVTFDAGGLSLKPSASMLTMKCDMGGAATVLGATLAAARQGLQVAVDTWVPAVENMTAGEAYKLGDILRYPNGVTVEIHNTDAEGRLVLADALIQACKVEGVTHVVDAATLTGACVVALGGDFTGLFTSSDELASALDDAAEVNGEGLWRMPLHKGYSRMIKGTWGQIKNVGGRDAGATTAALFLQHFVSQEVEWAHLDIAGPAFADSPTGPYVAGATGQMVRTLASWLEGLAR